MRPKKIVQKQKPVNLLQEESLKLKEKLELLKQQVTRKKIEKQMNKTTQATSGDGLSKFLKPNIKNQTQYPANDKKLHNILCQMGLQNIVQRLLQKGVSNYHLFLALQQTQIDQWKDIPVGGRIKMKKYIKENKNQLKIMQNSTFSKKQSIINSNKKQEKNIEEIIKNRQHNRIFVPLSREIQQNQSQGEMMQQMTEHDQDVIIKSFMNIFQPRKGILKKSQKKCTESVKWSKQVQRMQVEFKTKKHIKYPKESIMRQTLNEFKQQQSERSKYCWKCIKKIQKTIVQYQQKTFCSQNCCNQYQQQIKENMKMLQHFSNNKQHQQQISTSKPSQKQREVIQDIQLIDLSIL